MTLLMIFALATATGVVVHLGVFIRGEWHMRAPYVVMVHALLLMADFWLESRVSTAACPGNRITASAAGYLVGLFTSMAIYRVLVHALRRFPGPRMASISKLWHVYQNLDSTNYKLLDRMYQEYGEVVRIGPNELAIFHPDAIELVEGFATKCWRPDYDDIISPDFSLAFERNKQLHDARRNVWSRATGSKAIESYRPRLQRQVEVLNSIIDTFSREDRPVYVNDLMYFYAFDSMGEFAFNQDFGMMRNEKWHDAAKGIKRAISILGPMKSVIWLIRIGFYFLPWFWRIGDWFNALHFCQARLEDRIKNKSEEPDISAYFIQQAEKEGFTEDAWKWLRGDGPTVVVAGSDTTAPTLTFLFYALAKYAKDQEMIHAEVAGVDPFDISAVAACEHLNAVINETLRLWPVAATTVVRQSPPEGFHVGNTFIPGNCNLVAPRWTISKLESAFGRPEEFIPERWYSKPELVKNRHAFHPFGAGRTTCVGQGIAMTQIRMVMASIVKKYMISFTAGEHPDRVILELKDQLTLKPGKLVLRFERRPEA